MRIQLISRPLIALVVVIALFAIGCSGDGGDSASTTTSTTTVPAPSDLTPAQQQFITAFGTASEGDIDASTVLASGESVCLNLALLQAAGTPPGYAADAIDLVVLHDVSTDEKAEYGLILALAPTTLCTDLARYGENVAYWLGF